MAGSVSGTVVSENRQFEIFRGTVVFRRIRVLKTRWLLSILLISGILGIGIAGIDVGTSGVNSAKVYVTLAPWGKVAPPKESDTVPKSLAELIECKKQAESMGKKYNQPSPWTIVYRPSDSETSPVTKASVQQKKKYTVASPWAIVETKKTSPIKPSPSKPKKTRMKRDIPPRPQKVFMSASPWAGTDSYTEKKLPKPEKVFTSTSPWTKAAPASGTKTEVTKHSAVTPPNSSRIIACELRLARVSDGKVISQVSALDSYANIKRLSDVMIGRLEQESSGGSVIMMTLCNRRGTRQGQLIAEEMSENITAALKNAGGFKFVGRLNLRDIFPTEQKLESARDITAPRFRILFKGAEYVVIGGVALNKPPPTRLKSASTVTTDDDDLN